MRIIINKKISQKGTTAILTALFLMVLLGIAAFAVDLGSYFLAHNELQNAADAGALAGTRVLYIPGHAGVGVNASGFVNEDANFIPSANQVAHDTAETNVAQGVPVDVDWVSGNTGDVRRGHWSFATRTFTPSDSTDPVNLGNFTFEELDIFMSDNPFINAVEVTARRRATPLLRFFARIFGNPGLEMEAKAIAYLGFSGEIKPGEADLPIVICEDSILINGEFRCNIGRMINSGTNLSTNDTGRWTSFETTDQCRENVNVNNNELVDLISCDTEVGGNPNTIHFGEGLATNNGEMNALSDIRDCFRNLDGTDPNAGIYNMWQLHLPVAKCTQDPGCAKVIGLVSLYVAWVNYNQPESQYIKVPKFMYAPTDEDGDPILDENGDILYVNWPGDNPGEYNNVDMDELIPFMLDLYNYYTNINRNSYITLESDITAAYGADWQTTTTVENFFVDGDMTGDPNVVDEANVDGRVRWASFIQRYHLENIDQDPNTGEVITVPAPWNSNAMYFLPSCDVQAPQGVTGGKNYGILAKIPALVD